MPPRPPPLGKRPSSRGGGSRARRRPGCVCVLSPSTACYIRIVRCQQDSQAPLALNTASFSLAHVHKNPSMKSLSYSFLLLTSMTTMACLYSFLVLLLQIRLEAQPIHIKQWAWRSITEWKQSGWIVAFRQTITRASLSSSCPPLSIRLPRVKLGQSNPRRRQAYVFLHVDLDAPIHLSLGR